MCTYIHTLHHPNERQVFMVPNRTDRTELLSSILMATEGRVLIFVNTKIAADKLAHSMNDSDVAVADREYCPLRCFFFVSVAPADIHSHRRADLRLFVDVSY